MDLCDKFRIIGLVQ